MSFSSATEPVDRSTAVRRMLAQMLGVNAWFHRDTIIERVISGTEHKAARACGLAHDRSATASNDETDRLKPDLVEAATVR